MSAVEKEIIERIHKMDEVHQKQVLEFIRNIEETPVSLGEWLEELSALRAKLSAKYGKNHFGNVQDILDEVRVERLNDLMGGS